MICGLGLGLYLELDISLINPDHAGLVVDCRRMVRAIGTGWHGTSDKADAQ